MTPKDRSEVPVQVLDQAAPYCSQLSWFPDGIRLAYVELVSKVETSRQVVAHVEIASAVAFAIGQDCPLSMY